MNRIKSLFLLIIALLASDTLWAQVPANDSTRVTIRPQLSDSRYFGDGLSMERTLKYWEDGPLTLNDFTTRPGHMEGDIKIISELGYGMKTCDNKWKVRNTIYYAPGLVTYMNPYSSWMDPDHRNESELKYMQTAFDYVELCRRRAQNDIASGGTYSFETVARYHMHIADSFLNEMREDVKQGQDTAAVNRYSDKILAELAQTPEAEYTEPDTRHSGWALGMHAGAWTDVYLGEMGTYVKPIVGFDFGWDFDIRRFNIYLDMMYGSSLRPLMRDIPRDGYRWDAGEKITGGNMHIALGYALVNSQWWKLAPFAGIGVGFIDYPFNPLDPDDDSEEISGFRCLAGINTDFKLRRWVDYRYAPSIGEMTLRTRLFVAHTAFATPCPAWSINLGVSINFLGWLCPTY